MDAVFKALADESRRKLLDELHRNTGQTLTQLCGLLDMTRQTVSKHLALLESANLVVTVWRVSPVGSKGTTPGRNRSLLVVQNPPPEFSFNGLTCLFLTMF